jgi:hypothetical protein
VNEKPQVLAMHGRHEFVTVFAPQWELDEVDFDMWAPLPSRQNFEKPDAYRETVECTITR